MIYIDGAEKAKANSPHLTSLAIITNQPIWIERIRAGRQNQDWQPNT